MPAKKKATPRKKRVNAKETVKPQVGTTVSHCNFQGGSTEVNVHYAEDFAKSFDALVAVAGDGAAAAMASAHASQDVSQTVRTLAELLNMQEGVVVKGAMLEIKGNASE